MDTQAYIQSGIIESYVLGMASAEEAAELEQLALQHPEIQQAIDDFADMLEQQALQNAVQPPSFVKQRILAAIQEEQGDIVVPMHGTAAEIPLRTFENTTAKDETPVRSITTAPPRRVSMWKYIAAASIILLVASAAYNVYLYNRYSETSEQYITLLNERNSLQANNNIYQTTIKQLQSANSMMADPAMAKVKMEGLKSKDDAALVLWDTRTKDVYLVANKLPAAQSGKQYQLWAIVDGKPVDAGMLDENCSTVCKMKNIPKAEAFAITLEQLGGSPDPKGEMYVLGKI